MNIQKYNLEKYYTWLKNASYYVGKSHPQKVKIQETLAEVAYSLVKIRIEEQQEGINYGKIQEHFNKVRQKIDFKINPKIAFIEKEYDFFFSYEKAHKLVNSIPKIVCFLPQERDIIYIDTLRKAAFDKKMEKFNKKLKRKTLTEDTLINYKTETINYRLKEYYKKKIPLLILKTENNNFDNKYNNFIFETFANDLGLYDFYKNISKRISVKQPIIELIFNDTTKPKGKRAVNTDITYKEYTKTYCKNRGQNQSHKVAFRNTLDKPIYGKESEKIKAWTLRRAINRNPEILETYNLTTK